MSRFNFKTKSTKTTNLAGGESYQQSPKLELVSILLTSFVQDQYYKSAKDGLNTLASLAQKVNPLFSAKAAIYARNEFGMRSISHALAGELASLVAGKEWAKDFYTAIIRRPDDMMEILSYYKSKGNGNPTNAMKKGFAASFDKFDAYQLSKYRSEGKTISLVDIVNLCHPKSTEKNSEALRLLVEDKLKSSETWESKLSAAGKSKEKEKSKEEAWSMLIKERKIGYFALLRNLRNIIEQAPEVIDDALLMLTNDRLIKKSLVFPFRYLTAFKMISSTDAIGRKVRNALDKAINISCNNIPAMKNTLVVIDNSGSMSSAVAGSDHLQCAEAGAIFGMALAKKSNADIMEFGTSARYIPYNLNDSVTKFGAEFQSKNRVGHGTDFHSIFNTANKAYDRIVIFSDMQGWIGNYTPKQVHKAYCQKYNCNPFIYSFDLRGYGTMQFPEDNVFALSGFSDKVFDLMQTLETDKQALIKKIEAVKF